MLFNMPSWVLEDVASQYRRFGGRFTGFSAASPEVMARALTAVEDDYELSRSKLKQGVRVRLRGLRRDCEQMVSHL